MVTTPIVSTHFRDEVRSIQARAITRGNGHVPQEIVDEGSVLRGLFDRALERARLEAKLNNRSALVVTLSRTDFRQYPSTGMTETLDMSGENLKGIAYMMFVFLEAHAFRPVVEEVRTPASVRHQLVMYWD